MVAGEVQAQAAVRTSSYGPWRATESGAQERESSPTVGTRKRDSSVPRSPEPQPPAGNPEAGTESSTSHLLHKKSGPCGRRPGWGFCQETSGFPTLWLLSQEHRGRA